MSKTSLFIHFIYYILILCQGASSNRLVNRGDRFLRRGSSILDTGRGSIGIFLNKSVKNLRPLRKHYHWKIHHHHHNREDVLQEIHVLPRDITLCDPPTKNFCPPGSTALCTKNSAIRCLTNLWETELCGHNMFSHCAKLSLPCDKFTPECRATNKPYYDVLLTCIATVNVYANLVHVNGTLAARDLIKVYPPHFFCETVLAMPAKLTEGEEVFSGSDVIFGEFVMSLFGLNI